MNSNRISNTARERKTQYPEMELETGDTGKLPDHGQCLSSVPRRRPLPSTAELRVWSRERVGGAEMGRSLQRHQANCAHTQPAAATSPQGRQAPPGQAPPHPNGANSAHWLTGTLS